MELRRDGISALQFYILKINSIYSILTFSYTYTYGDTDSILIAIKDGLWSLF